MLSKKKREKLKEVRKLNKKIIATIFVFALAMLLPYLAARNILGVSSPETAIHVDPPTITKSVCETFDINVTVTDVENLYEYEFNLSYDTSILDALKVEDGHFLNEGKFYSLIEDEIGEVQVRAASFPPAQPVSGDGTLATIQFRCIGSSQALQVLRLHATSLKDPDGNEISHDTRNGECWLLAMRDKPIYVDEDYTLCHDIAFMECSGFIINASNIELDLNNHKIMFGWMTLWPGPGPTGIVVNEKSRVTIKNGAINNFQYGIWLEGSSEVNITFINVYASTKRGIGIRDSNDVNITFNNISGSGEDGVGIDENSFDVSILGNNISRSGDVGVGIYDNSFNISVLNNTVTDNDREGIHLKDSNHNVVSGNEISENGYYGIYLYNSNNNTIDTNTLLSNQPGGIYMENANQNIIYHNNFIDNPRDVECMNSKSIWDAGYGTVDDIGYGGNCWSDYSGVDLFSGKNQDVPGSDGIGDTIHTIDKDNQDNYPVMKPWGSMLTEFGLSWKVSGEETVCQVAAFSNSSITGFNFNKAEGEMSFSASNGTFCKLIIPKEALDGSFFVMIDDVPTACIINWDGTHHFINFTLASGNHEVKITGEMAARIVGDLNGDGIVNILDISMAAVNFGKETDC